MKALVLAEKPSVAKEIARVLGCHQKQKNYIEGPQYVITWALGHLVTLAEPEDYDNKYKEWKIEDLPIMPEQMNLKLLRETTHQYRAIAQLAKRNDLGELIIATDAGREGELVARWIMQMIKWKKPFKRLWISSQTDQAIKEGFAKLKPGSQYDALYHSALCRAEADWLIGLNLTRALTCKYNAQLAAGRVQSPTLAMIVEREKEIQQFRPVEYRLIEADFGRFKGIWQQPNQQDSRLFDLAKAETISQKIQGAEGKVKEIKTAEKNEPVPLAYDLTELQRDANRFFNFTAKQTLTILQRLYEQHKLVTYPRTDSRHLTSDMVHTLKTRLEKVAIGPYAALVQPLLTKQLPITKRIVDDSKVTDHHAIIPTEERVSLVALDAQEKKLYDLIVRRFIALFYPAYRYESIVLRVEVAGETFIAKGKVVKDLGWKKVYSKELSVEEWEDSKEFDEQKQTLPPVQKGEQVKVKACHLKQEFTQAPARHTEASLLTQMEKHNLGTPATRADIIEKLLHTETIERQNNRLLPTKKGLQLIQLVVSELRSPELTAKWERELEHIARGQGNRQKFIQGIRQQTIEMVKEVKNSTSEYKAHNVTGSRCPECSQYLLEVKGKKGKILTCPDRSCGYRRVAERQLSNKRCPQCKKKMELRTGKAGKFFQCRPCNVIEMAKEKENVKTHRKLVEKYTDKGDFAFSLGDALKAALEQKEDK